MKYKRTLIGILQAAALTVAGLVKALVNPHQPMDWTYWAWIAAYWIVLPGLGFFGDRSIHSKTPR